MICIIKHPLSNCKRVLKTHTFAIHKLTDLAKGTTLNVGIVKGGEAVNMVAPSAEAQIDLRYIDPPERTRAVAAIEEIVATSYVPGTTAKLEILGEFLPLNPTPESEKLFAHYQAAARDAGLSVEGEFSGGCADSGFTAAVGCPTICAVGPVGGAARKSRDLHRGHRAPGSPPKGRQV